jgi:hypothetical protein
MAQERLCSVCQAFGLSPSDFYGVHVDNGRSLSKDDTYHAGFLTDIRNRTYCPLCRLMIRAVEDSSIELIKDERFYEIRLMWPYQETRLLSLPRPRGLRLSCLPWSIPRDERAGFQHSGARMNELNILEEDLPNDSLKYGCARRIDNLQIDFSCSTRWLELCKTTHGACCAPLPELGSLQAYKAPWFWLIDVKRECLVKPTESIE